MNRKLSSELVSLIHHIALNEAGWWDKVIQKIIISSVWLNKTPSTIDKISQDLKENFGLGITLGNEILNKNIQSLCDQNILYKIFDNQYKLSEKSRSEFENDLNNHESLIERVREFFNNQVKINCPEVFNNDCWNTFNDKLLIPTVNQLGAKTYELISGHKSTIEQTPIFHDYIDSFDEKLKKEIKKVVVAFFDSNNNDCRDYILRIINAYFYREAGNLSSETLQKINNIQSNNIEFNLFIDTNFLFSIMNLHDNPSNEAAISLKKLIDAINNKVRIRLYVTGRTLQESSGVIEFHKNNLKGISLKSNLIAAAINYEFSGFEKKYFDEISKTKKPINPDDYFEPYLKNILTVVRKLGVEYYNENYDKLSMDQNVIDDILESQEYQERLEKKERTYEQLLHDIMLWHFVKDKRPDYIESHIDAKYWIVTIDYRFLGFDRYKGKGNNSDLNLICMHPASLIQMLQFWVPRSKEFEEAILSNIRIPLFYNEFDNDSESMANLILKRLSHFENIENLSEDTITAVLQNKALINKLKSNQEREEQIDLIKDAIIEENNKIQNELNNSKSEKTALQTLVLDKDSEIKDLKNTIEKMSENNKESKNLINSLENRIKKIEDEKIATKKYEEEHDKWISKKNQHANDKWEEHKKSKFYLIYYIFICFLFLFVEYKLISDDEWKIYIPVITSIIGFVLPFILHKLKIDKLINSFNLIFSPKKTKDKMLSKYKDEYDEKEPEFE